MYDVIIIGGGPAGVTAGIYIKRAGFNVLILTNENSSLQKTDKIENYYGFENPISGKDLYENGIKQAERLGINIIKKEAISIKYSETYDTEETPRNSNDSQNTPNFEIITANQGKDEKYEARYVILATGVNRISAKIKGIERFEGKGVSYCAVCDAAFYRNKEVAVLGNGNYAIGEIEELLPIAKKVTMLTNGKEPIENRDTINIDERIIREVRGENKIEEVAFEDGTIRKIDGLFVAQGTASSLDFAKKIGAKIENNNIVVDENMQTTVKNIYACGDCTGGILQISKAIYDGTKAGLAIIKELRKERSI